ncbi:hypothetical protein LDJ79_18790, partial [Vibrio tritonius]
PSGPKPDALPNCAIHRVAQPMCLSSGTDAYITDSFFWRKHFLTNKFRSLKNPPPHEKCD